MAISQKLHTKLVQKLILTPSLQQAIKLLPMSTLELSELLNQEMVENPMLEEVPTEELQPIEATAEKQDDKAAVAEKEKGDTWDDQDYEYFFGDYLDDGYRPRTPTEVKELPPIENTLSTAASLSDHLLWQLSMQTDEPMLREIGEAIIGNLDDDGILVATVDELSAMGPWPTEEVERALRLIQGFDPIGVAARDLQECLLLQLRHLGMAGTPSERIVTEHMRLLQNHQVPELARKLGMSIDDLKQHIELIRHLDPKPGSRYNPSQSQYVIPDVYIVKIEDQYVAVLNEEGLPQLRISPVYRRLLDKGSAENTDETRAYVKDKFRSALWLIKSVEQRQKTIHKVASSIINFQRDFLDHGIEYLRPLVLRDVANDIGMHESTVSRVVTNKYMHTPQGVFEMKYFFHSGIASSFGEAVSSVTIKQRIRKIIEQEDPRKPLSDSKIVSILQREGLELARRTIAKYREELKIPTSNQRKVLYQASPRVPDGQTMRLELTGRHITISASIRALVQERLAPMLRKLNDSAVSAQVVLTKEKTRVHAEVTLHARGEHFLHGEATGRDVAAALGAAVDKVDRQAQRLKNKWSKGKRQGISAGKAAAAAPRPERGGQGSSSAKGAGPAGARAAEAERGAGEPALARIIRARRYEVKPMSVEEAAMEVADGDDTFLVFRNAATDTINVLFRRPDGNLGLIEPEA